MLWVSKHLILGGSSSSVNSILLLDHIFCFDETKNIQSGTGFFINEQNSFINCEDVIMENLMCNITVW